ncbi:hypothetical protein ACXZ66_13815 [Corynebacterium sp. S7]
MGTRALYGLIDTPGTVGQMTTWEAAMWAGLLGSVMISLLVVDLHRRQEYTGLAELQRSTGIRPMTPWAAASLTGLLVATVLGVGSTLILWGLMSYIDELTTEGAVAFGLTIFLMVTGSMLVAQAALLLVNDGATLGRTALLTVAITYILRIIADTQEIEWINWFTPLGWRELIGAYTENDFGRVGILALVCVAGFILIGLAESRREYANGFLPRRSTSRRARNIRGPIHLRWLLVRGGLIAWIVVVAIASAFLLSLSGDMAELIGGADSTGQIFRDLLGGTGAFEAFIAYICQMVAIMISAAGIQQITTYRAEETARTVDLQRSTGMRRWVPLGTAALVATLSVILLTAIMHGAGAFGLATQESTISDDYAALAQASWSMLAPSILFVGAAVAIVGWVPRATPWAWAPLAASAVVTLMGEILQLPQWAIDLSPLGHPVTPEDQQWGVAVALGLTGLVLIAVGLYGAQRREIR